MGLEPGRRIIILLFSRWCQAASSSANGHCFFARRFGFFRHGALLLQPCGEPSCFADVSVPLLLTLSRHLFCLLAAFRSASVSLLIAPGLCAPFGVFWLYRDFALAFGFGGVFPASAFYSAVRRFPVHDGLSSTSRCTCSSAAFAFQPQDRRTKVRDLRTSTCTGFTLSTAPLNTPGVFLVAVASALAWRHHATMLLFQMVQQGLLFVFAPVTESSTDLWMPAAANC